MFSEKQTFHLFLQIYFNGLKRLFGNRLVIVIWALVASVSVTPVHPSSAESVFDLL